MPESRTAHGNPIGRRIVVVSTSGAGKTTLARELAARLGCPHIEADALHWGPNWTAPSLEAFRAMIDRATAGECWTFDGNYSKVRDTGLPAAVDPLAARPQDAPAEPGPGGALERQPGELLEAVFHP